MLFINRYQNLNQVAAVMAPRGLQTRRPKGGVEHTNQSPVKPKLYIRTTHISHEDALNPPVGLTLNTVEVHFTARQIKLQSRAGQARCKAKGEHRCS